MYTNSKVTARDAAPRVNQYFIDEGIKPSSVPSLLEDFLLEYGNRDTAMSINWTGKPKTVLSDTLSTLERRGGLDEAMLIKLSEFIALYTVNQIT